MELSPIGPGELLRGRPEMAGRPWPLTLRAQLCDLRPRFLPKGAVGRGDPLARAPAEAVSRRGYRAVARNGRVLLASDQPVTELAGRIAEVRLQTWHRIILPGDPPMPYGILLCIRCSESAADPEYVTRLARRGEGPADLELDVGGGLVLQFQRPVH
jgi:hypothetical protein